MQSEEHYKSRDKFSRKKELHGNKRQNTGNTGNTDEKLFDKVIKNISIIKMVPCSLEIMRVSITAC